MNCVGKCVGLNDASQINSSPQTEDVCCFQAIFVHTILYIIIMINEHFITKKII